MERMMEGDVHEITEENDGRRLDQNAEMNDDREDFAPENDGFRDEEGRKGELAGRDDNDEFSIWGEEARGYEKEDYGERSLEEAGEEGSAPSTATLVAAEKSEEEVQDVVEPDHVLAEIPVEIFNRGEIVEQLIECLIEQAELQRRNKLLELWIIKHTRKTQEKAIPADVTRDVEKMEQVYRQTLHNYKLQLDDVTELRARTIADMRNYEYRVQKTHNESAQMLDTLLDREREVATGLIYAKTGRKITEKAIDEITRRQVSRREILSRDRYEYIVLRHRLEELNTQLRDLETLGEGMTTMDYEVLHMAHMSHKDKLDERDRELEKLRYKIAEVVNAVAHYKEKETCLAEDIKFEECELEEYREQAVRIREDVNKLHLMLRDLRQAHNEKRHEAGLLVAQPVLREMERKMKLRDALRNDIAIIKHEIQQYGSANGRKK